MKKRVLILGGTTEARQLTECLSSHSELHVISSLAGRTASPAEQPGTVRRGAFGGTEGLVRYLRTERIDALLDATHPYAATMTAHAVAAAEQTRTPLVVLHRPAWRPVSGDRWTEVADVPEAIRALEAQPRNVFLALGRQQIADFARAPQHRYLIRSVDPVDPPLAVPYAQYILDRGPFDEEGELELLRTHVIDVIVAKNSGGPASYGKIAAARALNIPVLLLRRPPQPERPHVSTVAEALSLLAHELGVTIDRGVYTNPV